MIPEIAFKSGSECPPLQSGVLRLYSMRFCPYAQRTRIVLAHKNIPHEVVNINLKEKPEWYLEKINPLGMVPSIQKDDVIVFDSVIVNEYLDAVYPKNKLSPDDPYEKAKDGMFLAVWAKVITPFYKLFFSGCEDTDAVKDLLDGLDLAESELKSRGTPFFTGNDMGMLDVLLWPHSERIDLYQQISSDIKLDSKRYPKFLAWLRSMRQVPAIKATATVPELFSKIVKMAKEKNVDYDLGLK